jgi:hypothetical protein
MDISSGAAIPDVQISVMDMLGQSILTMPAALHEGLNRETITLAEKAVSGVYIVQLTIEGSSLYYRIVLER